MRIARLPSQDGEEFAILNASEELIPKMGGDAIFVIVYWPEDVLDIGYTATNGVVDDLERHLLRE